MNTCVTLFSGGGGVDVGAKAAGLTPVGAVEYSDAIAQVYADNHGSHVINARVQDVDYRQFAGVDFGWASPVCTRASVANPGASESDEDLSAAAAVVRFLREARPKTFALENVTQYRDFAAYKLITDGLTELGYRWDAQNVNAADMGVPQTRRRLIIRAVLGGPVPPLYPTHAEASKLAGQTLGLFAPPLLPWVGWYAAIEHLIDTLPESRFAPWQLARLPKELFDSALIENQNTVRPATFGTSQEPCHTLTGAQCGRRVGNMPMAYLVESKFPGRNGKKMFKRGQEPVPTVTALDPAWRALLIEGDAAGDRPPTCGTSAEPCFTLKTAAGGRVHRAFLAHPTADNPRFPCPNGSEPCFTVTRFQGSPRAYIVDGCNKGSEGGERGVTRGASHLPCFTIPASPKGTHRAWLEQGRVVAMTVEALAAFQSFPRDFKWPAKRSLASTCIGNAVPPLLSQRVIESLMETM